jgi:hypothetical protein
MQPESSDGLASVGTILPKEGAALLPGGSFRFCGLFFLTFRQARADGEIYCGSGLLPPSANSLIMARGVNIPSPPVTWNRPLDT